MFNLYLPPPWIILKQSTDGSFCREFLFGFDELTVRKRSRRMTALTVDLGSLGRFEYAEATC